MTKKSRSAARKKATNATSKAHGPYKLDDKLIKGFVDSILATPGGPIEMHCQALRVRRETYWRWRQKAAEHPRSIYARFVERVDEALGKAWQKLHVMAANAKPEQILFRRYLAHYPTERQQIELSGLGGQPLGPLVQFVFNQPQEVISVQEKAMEAQFVQAEESNVINVIDLANYPHPPSPKPLSGEELAQHALEREAALQAKLDAIHARNAATQAQVRAQVDGRLGQMLKNGTPSTTPDPGSTRTAPG
jgi:hypothetical protein